MKPQDLFPYFKKWAHVNISEHAELINAHPLWQWLLEDKYGGQLYGGYMENRAPLFDERHVTEFTTHLGVDFWVGVGFIVKSPINGTVIDASPPTETHGGWGGRLDILSDNKIWIFGHIEKPTLQFGDNIEIGQDIGVIAPKSRNGGWRPHLHVQVASLAIYERFRKRRDMDAYAAPSETLKQHYFDPLTL